MATCEMHNKTFFFICFTEIVDSSSRLANSRQKKTLSEVIPEIDRIIERVTLLRFLFGMNPY